MPKNFYEILNSTANTSYDELKRNYKQLILQCHPDKLQLANTTETTTTIAHDKNADRGDKMIAAAGVDLNGRVCEENLEFVKINEAWNTLKDPAKRKLYDAELLSTRFQTHNNIYARLTFDDMELCTQDFNEEQEDDEEEEKDKITTMPPPTTKQNATIFYTYNCRCGGQYIVDESAVVAAANDGNKRIDENSAAANEENIVDDEVIVECNECSLVICVCYGKRR